MERVAIYCRVSGAEQLNEGYSLAEQETRLRLYCEAQGWAIKDAYIDGAMTGSNMDRPALQRLIRDTENHEITKVCVYKLDRLSRSQKDTMYLIEDIFLKNHVDFVSMSETLDTSTPLGMAMIGILSVFAQLERSNINERMTMGRDARAKSGKYKGGTTPIGYRHGTNGEIVIEEYEAQIVRDIYRDFLSGKSASSIARDLNIMKMRDSHTWNASKICRIMSQPLYYGMMRWKGELLPSTDTPRIIDEATYNAAQAEIAKRSKKNERPQAQQEHATLWGGMIWCGKCGSRYTTFHDRNHGNPIHRYYCISKAYRAHRQTDFICKNKGIKESDLDEIVLSEIRKVTLDPSIIMNGTAAAEDNKKRSAITSRIAEINKSLDKLIDLYTIDGIDIQSISRRSKELKSERDTLTDQLKRLEETNQPDRKEMLNAIELFKETSEKSENKMDLYYIVRKLIKSITITDRNISIEWNI